MALYDKSGITPAALLHPQPRSNHSPPPSPSPSPPPDGDGVRRKKKKKGRKWFDIMIVGYTGQGKSTTADKVVIAYHKAPPDPDRLSPPKEPAKSPTNAGKASVEVHEIGRGDNPSEEDGKREDSVAEEEKDEVRSKRPAVQADDTEPVRRKNRISVKDLSFWTARTIDDIMEVPIVGYLKKLELSREMNLPHLDVNSYRKSQEKAALTRSCQLISNDFTKIRVLDVPGFFTVDSSSLPPSLSRAVLEDESENCTQKHLALMREVIRIQYATKIKFDRILYFLPGRGPLERPSEVLRQELLTLARYFGKSIFESMVIVVTVQPRLSEMPEMQGKLVSVGEVEMTREQFRIALKGVLPQYSKSVLPDPPIINISLLDGCEAIVEKIKGAKVARSALELSFDPGICIKCSSLIKEIEGERMLCIPKGHDKSAFVPYNDSKCHPLFVPKHSELEDILIEDGVKQIVLKKSIHPFDDTSIEVCHRCGKSPGEEGCMQVGSKYEIDIKGKQVSILVDHTNLIEKHKTLSQKGISSDDESSGDEPSNFGGRVRTSEAIEDTDTTSQIVVGRNKSKRWSGAGIRELSDKEDEVVSFGENLT